MRRRLRKKLHREFLTTVCAWIVTFDDDLRDRLLTLEPGTPLEIRGSRDRHIQRLIDRGRLRYQIALAKKWAPQTARVIYWAQEFPTVRDDAVIFSLAELGLAANATGPAHDIGVERKCPRPS